MADLTSSISPKFQITIPKEIRDKFPAIEPFNKVVISVADGSIMIRPKKRLRDVIGILGKPPISVRGKSFKEIRQKAYKTIRKI